ncbi:hypothetical protein M3667_15400 [Microbacterium sp. P26]|uniref:hypothetical protein n=1 Tax=Microbacterium TaxID=33882 RepID=UPI00203EFB96|nr:hypothetical protein [Microbacterium sp. P26]MCM3503257.1 hypothetical protein [Microbacterium sp. P26]
MSENPTLVASRLRTASVLFSAAALILLTMGLLLSWSRVAVLIAPVLMGAAALVFAVRARRSAPAK